MRTKPYYSVRTGKHPHGGTHDLNGLKRLFAATYSDLDAQCLFQQALGFECVDAGSIPGTAGTDLEAFFFRKLKKPRLWPLHSALDGYTEDDLFDVIELLHDCAAKGESGNYHSWNQCGWHYETFDVAAGQNAYRLAVNELLRDYEQGYQLTAGGEVVALPPLGLGDLERAANPPGHKADVQDRVAAAVDKFRRRGASLDERRDAIRDLADVLEYLRPDLKRHLGSDDESDLFNIANNFGLRHHNTKQKTKYDRAIWYSWIFYYYLATIHAATRLIARPVEHTKGKK